MHTHTDTHTHPAARTSLAQRPPLAWWLQAHQGGLPPPRCLPACSHLCTTMSGIFLSAQLGGGGAVRGAMSTACTWASARGKPAKQPPRPGGGWRGKGWAPRLPKSLGGASTRGARQGHTPTRQQPRPCQAALPLGVGGQGWALCQCSLGPAEALASVPQDMDGHPWHPQTYRHMHMCHTCAHTRHTQDTAGNKGQGPRPRSLGLWAGAGMRPSPHREGNTVLPTLSLAAG